MVSDDLSKLDPRQKGGFLYKEKAKDQEGKEKEGEDEAPLTLAKSWGGVRGAAAQ